jgi:hypothetical protein
MKLLEDYEKALQGIYDHVGLEHGLGYSLSDDTDYWWNIDDDVLIFADDKELLFTQEGNYYTNEIMGYGENNAVFTGPELTLVLVDYHTGDKGWMVLNNAKRVPDAQQYYDEEE